jgi:hypothetical protein
MHTYFLILLLLTTINISYGEVSIKPKIELIRNFDPCDSDPRISLRIVTDKITSSDSLFGFDFGIKFDSTKVRFINVSTQNTAMGKFTTSYSSANIEEQLVRGGGGVLGMNPIVGDTILFGVSFDYIANDFSSTTFAIEYIYMTDEFTKIIDLSDNVFEFSPLVRDLPNRRINILSSEKYVVFDSTLEKKLNIIKSIYSDNRLNNFDLKVNYNKNIISIDLLSNENYNIEKSDNGLDYDIYKISSEKFVSNENELILNCFQNANINDEVFSSINLEILDWDKKSCITNQSSNYHVEFKTYKKIEDSSSVIELIKQNNHKTIEIYDILGNKIYESKFNHSEIYNLKKGLYFVRVDETIKKIIIN